MEKLREGDVFMHFLEGNAEAIRGVVVRPMGLRDEMVGEMSRSRQEDPTARS